MIYLFQSFALGGATIFLIIATISKSVEPLKIIKEAPWQVVWFSIGLYIVVYGLKKMQDLQII